MKNLNEQILGNSARIKRELQFIGSLEPSEVEVVVDALTPVIMGYVKTYSRVIIKTARVLAPVVEPLIMAVSSVLYLLDSIGLRLQDELQEEMEFLGSEKLSPEMEDAVAKAKLLAVPTLLKRAAFFHPEEE